MCGLGSRQDRQAVFQGGETSEQFWVSLGYHDELSLSVRSSRERESLQSVAPRTALRWMT